MRNWFSTPNSEKKTIESDGAVNNSVVIQDTDPGYGFEIMVISAIICAIKLFEILFFVYTKHTKIIRKNVNRDLKNGVV